MIRTKDDRPSWLARTWFPASLVILVLLALPSVLLFALHTAGRDSAVNPWLAEHFNLSYHPSLTGWLALILLLVPLAVVLLYFLKLRRKPLSVPSTFLWRKSIEDLHVNALFQWLRNNLLLLFQLLFLLILIYAVLDFQLHARTGEGKHYILMIDNSASMAATDLVPSRLHWAKQEALNEIEAATEEDFGMVIVFNSSAEILQSYTSNRALLRQAVEGIVQTQRPTRIDEALSLADSLANPSRTADDAAVKPKEVEPGKERTYVAAEGFVTTVHLFSDGRFPDVPEFALGNLNFQFHTAGKQEREQATPALLEAAGLPPTAKVTEGPALVDNVALVALNVTRVEPESEEGQGNKQEPAKPKGFKLKLFASVLNFRNHEVSTRLQVEVFVNGKLRSVYETPVELPARQLRVERILDVDPQTPSDKQDAAKLETYGLQTVPSEKAVELEMSDQDDRSNVVLHAQLVGLSDHFPLDDEGWIVVGVVRRARILLVGPANPALSAFFEDDETLKVASVTRLNPEELAGDAYRKPAQAGGFDLVIFDRCAPAKEEDMPQANTFFIGRPPPPVDVQTLEKIANPQIRSWVSKHPIMRHLVGLHEIGVVDAFRMKQVPERNRLIEIDKKDALLITQNRQSYTDLILCFPILADNGEYNTNWPLLLSFPLFLRNVVYTLGNIRDSAGEETVQPGQAKTIRPDLGVSQIRVTDPAGKESRLSRGSRPDFTYGATDQVGIYGVAWEDGGQRSFAVNLLDTQESNIEPRPTIRIGAEQVALGREQTQTPPQPYALWKWLVAAALLVLLLEWYIYNRRVTI
jgi:hypothetical protein